MQPDPLQIAAWIAIGVGGLLFFRRLGVFRFSSREPVDADAPQRLRLMIGRALYPAHLKASSERAIQILVYREPFPEIPGILEVDGVFSVQVPPQAPAVISLPPLAPGRYTIHLHGGTGGTLEVRAGLGAQTAKAIRVDSSN